MEGKPILRGSRILLRQGEPRDSLRRFQLGRQPEFEHMCGGDSLPEVVYPPLEHWERWLQGVLDDPLCWVVEAEGQCVGSAGFHQVSGVDRSACYRIGLFDPRIYGMGYGKEVTGLLLHYGFQTMGLHRIELRVLDYNLRARRCYAACGFREEGVLRQSAWIDGSWHSDVVMSILEDEFLSLAK